MRLSDIRYPVHNQKLKLRKHRQISFLFTALMLITSSVVQAQQHYLFGSLHSHSEYSDGNMGNDPNYHTVYSCFQYIRQNTLNVGYWGISDHNHSSAGMAKADFYKGVHEADSANEDGVFPTLYGMEWGVISTGGHVLVYGIDSLIGWDNNNYDIYNGQSDYAGLFTKIAARGDGAFAYLAHMEDTDYGNLLSQPYNSTWDDAIVGCALRNGPAFSTDTTYGSLPSFNYIDRFNDLLKKGYHVAPGIDHDNHYIVFGRTHTGRTVVIADSITRTSIISAIRSMHFYASDDWNAEVSFSANGYMMGSTCSDTAATQLHVQINDPDAESISSVKIWYGVPGNNIAPALLTQINGSANVNYTHSIPATASYYYYAEITQGDGDKIWTAPIWYTRNGAPPALELLTFEAENVNNFAKLHWATLNENLMDHIEVERSLDSILFFNAANVAPTGGLGITANYNWTDPNPLDSTTFYRLRLLQLTGLATLSDIRKVDPLLKDFAVSLYPNILNGSSPIVSVSHRREELFKLEIIAENGQLAGSTVFYTVPGTLEIPLSDFSLAGGMYFLRIFNSDYSTQEIQRFILY